jgi:hypothetical protein
MSLLVTSCLRLTITVGALLLNVSKVTKTTRKREKRVVNSPSFKVLRLRIHRKTQLDS